jgi:membrane-bound metal-dependent hydrolase YbcI (DUF457 family)
MDILTHAGIGLIAAAPLLGTQPQLALGIVAGSVLPDLDALSRIFGKRAFLRLHQTWSHAFITQMVFSAVVGLLAGQLGFDGLKLGFGLFAGLLLHTFLDFTNTLGVTLLAPFSRKRFCLEWVFFIDAFVLAATFVVACLSIDQFVQSNEVAARNAIGFFLGLAVYVLVKGFLRRRAGALAPDPISLIPSALYPWRFFGVVDGKDCVQLFQINALNGSRVLLGELRVLDESYTPLLKEIPEFVLMRKLSPAYHVVSADKVRDGELVRCRDLRTRNFSTTFGDLEVLIRPGKQIQIIKFHV